MTSEESPDPGRAAWVARWAKRLGIVAATFVAVVAVWLAAGAIVYSPEYVVRVLSWGESDIGDYLNGFPSRPLRAAPTPFEFTLEPDEGAVRAAFESTLGVADFGGFLAASGTQAFIVIKGDRVLYEQYFNGYERASMLTSFSVAKSLVSALVGIAIDEGHIAVDDPITEHLPEMLERDEAFSRISIRDLLLMAGGLDYQESRWWLFNGDDPLTTYYPDQREIALTNTQIVDQPGAYFLYNKYHPQLLGMILERATGMSVTEYTQTRLWDPLGMEYDGAWALDSLDSGFEKMEAGLNARAIDYAKLGRLFLNGGDWDGTQVMSADWVAESTSLDPATHTPVYYAKSFGPTIYDQGNGYYKYMWYGKLRGEDPPDIAAEGDHGQIIYISPANDVIIVRNGTRFGIPLSEWTDAFYRVADHL